MKKSHALATGFHAHMSSVREVCYEWNVYFFYWCACVVGILLRERERGFLALVAVVLGRAFASLGADPEEERAQQLRD